MQIYIVLGTFDKGQHMIDETAEEGVASLEKWHEGAACVICAWHIEVAAADL